MEHSQVLQSYNRLKRIEVNEGVSVFPQQNIRHPESTQETLEPQTIPAMLSFIEFRLQQLNNRRFLLLQMQHFKRKSKDDGDETTEGTMNTEDSDRLCELDSIQKEVEMLLEKKKELQKQELNSKLSNTNQGQEELCPTYHEPKIPSGEIFLPPPPVETDGSNKPEQNIVTETTETKSKRKTGPVVPVNKLGREADFTQCPSCQEVVLTEIQRKVGEATCLASCICAMVGFAAGCCLIPFFMDRLKNVHHKCPQCHAHLHTYSPF